MNTPELLPCPFCGGPAELDTYGVPRGDGMYIELTVCNCSVCFVGTESGSVDEVVATWNKRRHPERALVAFLQRGATLQAIDPAKPIVINGETLTNLNISYHEKE